MIPFSPSPTTPPVGFSWPMVGTPKAPEAKIISKMAETQTMVGNILSELRKIMTARGTRRNGRM